jgi:hypothetical protein
MLSYSIGSSRSPLLVQVYLSQNLNVIQFSHEITTWHKVYSLLNLETFHNIFQCGECLTEYEDEQFPTVQCDICDAIACSNGSLPAINCHRDQ